MSLGQHLNLTNVTINRVTVTTDSYGDPVTTTLSTIIPRAAIWSLVQTDRRVANADKLLSDKMTPTTVYTLAIEYGAYAFTIDDKTVVNGSEVYDLVGMPDNISHQNILVTHGMERSA